MEFDQKKSNDFYTEKFYSLEKTCKIIYNKLNPKEKFGKFIEMNL